ncbi:uncharacterized protein LOC128198003 [Bicyclus anynana]|uniref:Uncharacterized protein LOC128198003 n=1 Tax=Bicyclus anynana TaxID=110368 RepID=A0ABM3LLC7_BICAN|nr:uncharacterized protein LOC128198003 [Bicyclus anynana]
MAGVIGNLTMFEPNAQNWELFGSKLKQFLALNKIEASEEKRAVLITHLSDDAYRLLINLVHPGNVEETEYDVLIKTFNKHFLPRRSTFADKDRFYSATQMAGEALEDFAARLRGLSVYCNFGEALDVLLRDRFVLGLALGPERDRLFEKDASNLTFANALELAQKVSCARKSKAATATGTSQEGAEVGIKEEPLYHGNISKWRSRAPRTRRDVAVTEPEDDARPKCKSCGLRNHLSEKCFFRFHKCKRCLEIGHISKACAVKKGQKVNNMHIESMPEENVSDGCNGSCEECQVFSLRFPN